jgi:hypothetical protein
MALSNEIKELENTLKLVREKLMSADVTEPGFGEMRTFYNELSDTLIKAAHKADDEVARSLEAKSKEIVEEWASSTEAMGNWTGLLKQVVSGVGGVLSIAGIPNPLSALVGE